jgi:hypothetical protein
MWEVWKPMGKLNYCCKAILLGNTLEEKVLVEALNEPEQFASSLLAMDLDALVSSSIESVVSAMAKFFNQAASWASSSKPFLHHFFRQVVVHLAYFLDVSPSCEAQKTLLERLLLLFEPLLLDIEKIFAGIPQTHYNQFPSLPFIYFQIASTKGTLAKHQRLSLTLFIRILEQQHHPLLSSEQRTEAIESRLIEEVRPLQYSHDEWKDLEKLQNYAPRLFVAITAET